MFKNFLIAFLSFDALKLDLIKSKQFITNSYIHSNNFIRNLFYIFITNNNFFQ